MKLKIYGLFPWFLAIQLIRIIMSVINMEHNTIGYYYIYRRTNFFKHIDSYKIENF